jgi:hypothetical protein
MKTIISIFFITTLFWSCKSQNENNQKTNIKMPEKIEIKEELEWSELESFINHFAKTKTDLKTGKDTIISFLNEKIPSFNSDFLKLIDFEELRLKFIDWVKVPLTNSPPEEEIIAFYFGLFNSSDPQLSDDGELVTVLYLSGSITSPEHDSYDWAVDPKYFPPERYCILSAYSAIDKELRKYKNTSDIEQILFNGITNLILTNSLNELKEMTGKNEFHVGSGYDSGDCYIIGKVE